MEPVAQGNEHRGMQDFRATSIYTTHALSLPWVWGSQWNTV